MSRFLQSVGVISDRRVELVDSVEEVDCVLRLVDASGHTVEDIDVCMDMLPTRTISVSRDSIEDSIDAAMGGIKALSDIGHIMCAAEHAEEFVKDMLHTRDISPKEYFLSIPEGKHPARSMWAEDIQTRKRARVAACTIDNSLSPEERRYMNELLLLMEKRPFASDGSELHEAVMDTQALALRVCASRTLRSACDATDRLRHSLSRLYIAHEKVAPLEPGWRPDETPLRVLIGWKCRAAHAVTLADRMQLNTTLCVMRDHFDA